MLKFIYNALESFRSIFSYRKTWIVFTMLVLGFLGTTDVMGVTSFCRFWGLDEIGYHTLLNFFRSKAWSFDMLVFHWSSFVLAQNETIQIQGRVVLFGDHTQVPKDGRRMPGAVSLRQDSETQSKPSYFRGHCWGSICVLVGTLASPFCLPLALQIHQGLIHIDQENKEGGDKKTMGTRIIQMAYNFAITMNTPSVMVLDAYFPSGNVFNLANSIWSIELRQPILTLIIKAKSSYTAYFEPDGSKQSKLGRKYKYGEKIKLMEIFDHSHFFVQVQCMVYGKVEEVSITTHNLLWKPTGDLIRFVFAVTSHGPIVLMCSDLNQDPILALELYSKRIRIEIMFDMLKNLICAFNYRFWTKDMPSHSRKPKKNKYLKKPTSSNAIDTVKLCWKAYEGYVMLAAISLGLLQLIALKYSDSIWNHFGAYLRTRSRELPSERTVKHVVQRLLINNYVTLAPGAIMEEIREKFTAEFNNESSDKFENSFAIS